MEIIEKQQQLNVSPEQALDLLESEVENNTQETEKNESGAYARAKRRLEDNKTNPNDAFRLNLRAISKILGATNASAEDHAKAIDFLNSMDQGKVAQWKSNHKNKEEVIDNYLNSQEKEKTEEVKKTIEVGEKDKFSEFVTSNFDINNLSASQEILLRTTKSSQFLTAEQKYPGLLKKIFFQKGRINFYDNPSVRRNVGLGDLLESTDVYASIDGTIGKRSFDGNKVGYLDRKGRYLPIYGGEKISTDVAQFENFKETDFGDITSLPGDQEKVYKQNFITEIQQEEVDQEKLEEECKEEIRNKGLDGIDKPTGRQFFEMARVVAEKLQETDGIPWQVTVAQALLESGKGRSGLAKKNKNYFGMKGKGRTYWTDEVRNGVRKRERHSFRSYENFSDSFLDHNQLLSKGRYVAVKNAYKTKQIFKVSPSYIDNSQKGYKGIESRVLNTPADYLWGIIDSGYATEPTKNYLKGAESMLSKYGATLGPLSDPI
jgi:flagellum-specific peptidoglycan hydrolase FlgJ